MSHKIKTSSCQILVPLVVGTKSPFIQLPQFKADPWWAPGRLTQKSSVASLEWRWCGLPALEEAVAHICYICCVIEMLPPCILLFILFYLLYFIFYPHPVGGILNDGYQSSSKINPPAGLMKSQ